MRRKLLRPSPEEEVQFFQEAMATWGKDLEKHLSSPEFIKSFLMHKKRGH